MLNHEQYNFFRWSERKQVWDPVDYETYIKYKNLGTKVDARYKDVELKQSKPVTVEPEKKKGLFKNRSLNEEIENVRRLLLNKK